MFSVSEAPIRILLVDDDANQITVLHQVLKPLGQVFFEQNGVKACEQALKIIPDVILLDIEMPGFNGYQVLEKLKCDHKTANIPVIFITAYNSVDDQLRCLRSGAVDFIIKPLQPELVAARVSTQLKLKDRERKLLEVSQHARVTLESIGDAVITTNIDGQVTYMNPTAELITGITLNEAKHKPIEQVMPLRLGNDGPAHINPIRVAIAEHRIVGMVLNCQMKSQNNQWIHVEDSAAPLISQAGKTIGAVIVFNDVNESQAMALKMSHALQYDQLTKLPNRFLLMDKLKDKISESQNSGSMLGLMLLDIDRFKLINEEFGFDFGDILLKKLAQQIKSQLTKHETLSRHTADEFIVLVPNLETPSHLASLAIQIQEHILKFMTRHPEVHNFSISIGLSIFPEDACDAQSLMLHADAALHRAKKDASHGRLCFYSQEMESVYTSRRKRYIQLKNAIAKHLVVPLYQPIICAKTGHLQAVEALMRIKDENGNMIPPSEFITLAEETELIIPLGELMINLVFDQQIRWLNQGLHIRVCINISPIQFLDPSFLPFILSVMDQKAINPNMVELELTESLMLENLTQIKSDMDRLRKLGTSISIDDFGTGYSCLSYLRDLPVDSLKIDKSFVAQLNIDNPDEVLVKTISTLAQSMKLSSIAEGVESQFQAQRLQELGVPLLQGYYFSKPVTADQIQTRYLI
ncbi:Protein-glutamate methylesterase/protein-glutamine glutaminase [Pseudoalteromonas sp. CIP111854]|uniref:Protein-glutamate methylesterase/protein-glutamine glutaminase n=1 Tax=Pseudoalteromonas holothuriae TaxID=2963714 RepID=A0A9W4QYA9_9GAMM|nr:EAL domain-containing protein [Pseudoalteromonas sp. CIP111854]CAH9058753.1 Protein-glutamate methylesterase/protein-glutamine glutaminase [Pseudoalteromonas sp. CIP111854]